MNPTGKSWFVTALVLLSTIIGLRPALAANEVNVYSYRKPVLINPLFEQFTQQTGIEVNVVHAEKGLLERLKREGRNTPADLILTTDIGRLTDLNQADLLQSVTDLPALGAIPTALKDTDGSWFGLTARARVLAVSKERVAANSIVSYEDLANPELKGRVCTRSGKHPYMIALLGSMIVNLGDEAAEQWLAGVKVNLARTPQGNDRAQVKAIYQGECDVAVINHYYMHKMLADAEQAPWANSVDLVFPNQEDRGTHMNISGMAMTKHAKRRAEALELMRFLVSAQGQSQFSQINGEYPVVADTEWSEQLKTWGTFKQDNGHLSEIAAQRAAAIQMMDRVGYDN